MRGIFDRCRTVSTGAISHFGLFRFLVLYLICKISPIGCTVFGDKHFETSNFSALSTLLGRSMFLESNLQLPNGLVDPCSFSDIRYHRKFTFFCQAQINPAQLRWSLLSSSDQLPGESISKFTATHIYCTMQLIINRKTFISFLGTNTSKLLTSQHYPP